jgi:hypothetical protein
MNSMAVSSCWKDECCQTLAVHHPQETIFTEKALDAKLSAPSKVTLCLLNAQPSRIIAAPVISGFTPVSWTVSDAVGDNRP